MQETKSKERQDHAKKYSQQVSEINRRSNSRSPSFGSPKVRFDADAYKKQLQRKLMKEMRDEEN